ncbi:MAG: cobalamin-dependent protein [Caldilineaceae bacterium]
MSTANDRPSFFLETRRDWLAGAIVERQWQLQPELSARYDEPARLKSVRDTGYTLSYLAHAIQAGEQTLFLEYIGWLKILLTRQNVPIEDLAQNLRVMRDVLPRTLPPKEATAAVALLTASIEHLPHMPSSLPSFLDGSSPQADLARRFLSHLLKGERQQAGRLILAAVAEGVEVRDIYLHVFQPCLREIGRLWQLNEISVAQEHFCTAATQLIMSQLYPYIFATPRLNRRLVAACVGHELHEVGLRMVADLFELDGWDTYYLGANTPLESIAAAVSQQSAHVLAISATMTFHLPAVTDLIAFVRKREPGSHVKILVGGYPFNTAPNLWRTLGADGYAPDAVAAIATANRLLLEN